MFCFMAVLAAPSDFAGTQLTDTNRGDNLAKIDIFAPQPFLQFLGCTNILYLKKPHFWCEIEIFENHTAMLTINRRFALLWSKMRSFQSKI